MLSFIYRLAMDFERVHGAKPNMLYLNHFHFERVRGEFADPHDVDLMMRVLGMTLMITEDAVNPHLARIGRPLAQPGGTGRTPTAGLGARG